MHFFNRKPLSRRTLLRGAGVSLALPMLEAMMPTKAQAQATPKRFFGFFYPNGTSPANWQPNGSTLSNSNLTPCLQDLAGFSSEGIWPACASVFQDITVVKNLHHDVYETGIHDPYWAFRCHKKSSNQSIKSLDQKILELEQHRVGYNHLGMSSTTDSGLGQGFISWKDTNTAADVERDPTVLFNRIFGADAGSSAADQISLRKARLFDFLREDVRRIKNKLGQVDRLRVEEFENSINQLENELQIDPNTCIANGIAGTNRNWHDKSKYFIDIAILAMSCDLTRVAMLQYSNSWGVNYSDYILGDGTPDAAGTVGVGSYSDHFISHRLGDRDRAKDLDAVFEQNPDLAGQIATERVILTSRFKVRRFAYLVDKLRNTSTPTGTLFDETLALYASENGNGDNHSRRNMPTLVAGRAGGFQPGRIINANGAHTAALHCGILNRFDFNLERYGDPAEGPLAGV